MFTSVVISVFVIFLFIFWRYRRKIAKYYRFSKNEVNRKVNNSCLSINKIIVADSVEKCDEAVDEIKNYLKNGILGFDCEWTGKNPISLLQLATHDENSGICCLFRLKKIGFIPKKLEELLQKRSILKIGVAPYEDSKKLLRDYGCPVVGTLDLRTLVSRLKLPCQKSLAMLCFEYLDLELDKSMELRCSDWEIEDLTDEQTQYAALDAYVAVLIYDEVLKISRQNRSFFETAIRLYENIQNQDIDEKLHNLPSGVIDKRFKVPHSRKVQTSSNTNNIPTKGKNSAKKLFPTRNKPLYHNCFLQAPDGEILCSCDVKKAEWYVFKELGFLVSENPFTVRLKFEPSGRATGKYYTQVKENRCVVCGFKEKFVRKNIVPKEYRRYFPVSMKSHQSHDILLLCPPCHEVSNNCDLQLRRRLAEMCGAPIFQPKPKTQNEEKFSPQRKLLTAVKVLRGNHPLPPKKREEFESIVKQFMGIMNVTMEVLETLGQSLEKTWVLNSKGNLAEKEPHGLKVVQYFSEKHEDLTALERLWREHFLETMKPRFLPGLWSVNHNSYDH